MNPNLLEVLPQIVKDINAALTADDLYTTTLHKSLEAFGVADGSVTLLDRATNEICIKTRVQAGKTAEQAPACAQDLPVQAARQVALSGGAINCPDVGNDPAWQNAPGAQGIGSLLCVPIAIDRRRLGAIHLSSPETGRFGCAEEQLLTVIGEQAALAIESHVLRHIGAELALLPVEEILPRIAQEACFLFAARSSAISLTDPRADEPRQGARFPQRQTVPPLTPRPDGLTQRVARSQKPLVIQNVQQHPDVKESTKQRGVQSILGVPVLMSRQYKRKVEVRGIGALFVDILEQRDFSQREQALLQTLANQASVAIAKARHTRSLARLNQIHLEIASSKQDILGLAGALLSHAARLVNAKGGRLCLLDEEGTGVQWAVLSNFPEKPVKIKMEATVGVFGRVHQTRQPFAKADYQSWPERRKDFDKHQFTAVAGVPILYQGELWGVLLVHDTAEGRVFDQEELDLLTNLGSLAAVAFANASRVDDLRRLIESASTAVIAIDNDGTITHFNRQAEQMLQYSRAEVIGQSIKNIYYYEVDARRILRLMLDSPEGKIQAYSTHLRSKKGQRIPIKLSASLLFDYEDRRSGSVGFFQDERRNEARMAIASLLDKQEVLQALVDQAWQLTGASHSAHLALNIESKLQVTAAHPPAALPEKQRLPIDIAQSERAGVSGRAFATGESQRVGDVRNDPDYIEFDPQTNSELAVPIKTQEGVIGVIDVQHPQRDAFGEADQQNLEILAQFAAIAIQNAQLYTESQIDKRRFEAIAEIIREATQSLEVDQLLRSTCHRLENIFSEKEAIASIRLYDPDADILRFKPEWHESFHRRIDVGQGQTTQSLAQGICGLVARTRRPLNVGEVETNPHFFRLISSTRSELSVPIHLDETEALIGVLDLQSPLGSAFSQSDLEFLELLARHLAVDIETAQLTEREKRRAQAQEAMREVGEVVTRSSELEDTLNQITQHVYKLAQDRGQRVNSVVLRLVRGTRRILAAAQPPELLSKLQATLREVEIAEGVDGKIGISGRAILTETTQNVGDVATDPDYLKLDDATRSELAIPILIDGEVIAAMDIECAERHAFDEDDVQVFVALAAQAGIAIYTARQYSALDRKHRHQRAIYKASRIIARGLSLDQRDLLYRILEQAVELILPATGTKVNLGVIQLYDPGKNELRRESIYPKGAMRAERRELGVPRLLERRPGHKIGINGRAVLEGRPQRVNDVSADPDYIGFRDSTRSELDVPLIDPLAEGDQKIIGVLGLESDELNAFDEDDEQALENLAELAVIAIRNSAQYRELEQTKATLAARTAVAWLATERATWQHKIVGHIGTIENYLRLMEKDLATDAPPEKLHQRLASIQRVIGKTRERKIAEPLDPDQGLETVDVDGFIARWLDGFYVDEELYPGISVDSLLGSGDARVRVNPGWFKLALENIVNNGIRAVEHSPVKEVKVSTAVEDGQVKIFISDTGPGIPPEIQAKIFNQLTKKESGGKGEGIGLMLSKTIFETYGGGVKVRETGPDGTTFAVWIPALEGQPTPPNGAAA